MLSTSSPFAIFDLFRVPNLAASEPVDLGDAANLLLESGDALLLESGAPILLESA